MDAAFVAPAIPLPLGDEGPNLTSSGRAAANGVDVGDAVVEMDSVQVRLGVQAGDAVVIGLGDVGHVQDFEGRFRAVTALALKMVFHGLTSAWTGESLRRASPFSSSRERPKLGSRWRHHAPETPVMKA